MNIPLYFLPYSIIISRLETKLTFRPREWDEKNKTRWFNGINLTIKRKKKENNIKIGTIVIFLVQWVFLYFFFDLSAISLQNQLVRNVFFFFFISNSLTEVVIPRHVNMHFNYYSFNIFLILSRIFILFVKSCHVWRGRKRVKCWWKYNAKGIREIMMLYIRDRSQLFFSSAASSSIFLCAITESC